MYVKDIKGKTKVEGLFLVREKHQGMTKGGKPYFAVVLGDKTGNVKARIWDNAEMLGELFHEGDIIRVHAWAIIYQGSLQLNIAKIEKPTTSDIDIREFLPASKKDMEQSFYELTSFIKEIENSYLKQLLKAIFEDASIAHSFKLAPAAKSLHHVYLGGLLEHTLQVTRLAFEMANHYPNLDRDLLIAAAMIHDIGKIYELSYQRSFAYTDRGRLLGHITMGIEIINEKLKHVHEFPDELALILKHLILSHHGQYEFGSPKRPKTLEALMLNYLDDLDSKMEGLKQFILREKKSDSKWTSYTKLFDRYIYTDTFIDNENEEDGETK